MITMRFVFSSVVFLLVLFHFYECDENVLTSVLNPDTLLAEEWHLKKTLCSNLKSLLMKVDLSLSRLEAAAQHNDTRPTGLKFIRLTQRELNATRTMVFRSIGGLHRLIHNNVTDIQELLVSSKARLKGLRSETLREEKAFASITELDNTIDKAAEANESRHAKGLVDNIIKAVASSADKLQKDLTDHVFENALNNPNLNKAGNVEAVIRLDEDGKVAESKKTREASKGTKLDVKSNSNSSKAKRDDSANRAAEDSKESNSAKMVKLVDAQDNQFVLSKGRDSTVPLEDKRLILDVVYLIILAALLGLVCQVIGFPPMFGHILAGIILGPSCFNLLKSVVQLETFGQFGVFLILFSVGLEFCPDRVKPVLRSALIASFVPALLLVVLCAAAGRLFLHASLVEGAFVGACLSLSSTPLIINFLSSEKNAETEAPAASSTADYSLLLLGILVLQDVYLALLMAVLPWLASALFNDGPSSSRVELSYALNVLKLLIALVVLVAITAVLYRFIAGPLMRTTFRFGRSAALLVAMGVAFSYLLVTHLCNLSMELGCFMAGVAFSGLGRAGRDELEPLVEPVRDFLSAIFFASIGLHVFPKFLVYQVSLLSVCTTVTVVVKFATCYCTLRLCVSSSDRARRYVGLVSAGLAQVSEFSFVLGSIARRLGLLSREVYLLILGVTTLSLLVAPILWKLFLYQANFDDVSFYCRKMRRLRCCSCFCKSRESYRKNSPDDATEALLDRSSYDKEDP